jgi:hypothetical protein
MNQVGLPPAPCGTGARVLPVERARVLWCGRVGRRTLGVDNNLDGA